ncbi:DMT family transporter [bacterium]|nr:DMT family transporter [bacterium]
MDTFIYLGETAALTGAALWAISSLLFERSGKVFTANGLNFFKSSIALILLLITALIQTGGLPHVDSMTFIMLFVSGIIGIGLGDTAYFESMQHMGPRRALLVGILSPPLTAIIAWFSLNEGLALISWIGIAITMGGVAWVVSEKSRRDEGDHRLGLGVMFGSIYAIGQALGTVMTRMALLESDVNLIWSVVIRILGGILMIVCMALFRRQSVFGLKIKPSANILKISLLATFMGAYLAMICQQVAIKFTHAGIAQTLLMSSHLFLLPLGRISGEKISWRAILGALIAMGGIAVLFLMR